MSPMVSPLLLTEPSFWTGVARSIDMFGLFTLYNQSPSAVIADARALEHDWAAVGRDLRDALDGSGVRVVSRGPEIS